MAAAIGYPGIPPVPGGEQLLRVGTDRAWCSSGGQQMHSLVGCVGSLQKLHWLSRISSLIRP